MKTALIVVEGTTQVSFEPETDWETSVLEQVKRHDGSLRILTGEVFECRGDYWRMVYHDSPTYAKRSSLILRLDRQGHATATEEPQPKVYIPVRDEAVQ